MYRSGRIVAVICLCSCFLGAASHLGADDGSNVKPKRQEISASDKSVDPTKSQDEKRRKALKSEKDDIDSSPHRQQPRLPVQVQGVVGAPRGVGGACCNPLTGQCSIAPDMDICFALGGEFQGPGSGCDPNPCIQPTDCNNFSGTVIFTQLPSIPPNTINQSSSDEINGTIAQEYLYFLGERYVTDVRWWGFTSIGTTPCDRLEYNFRIRFYNDAAGPGAGPTMPAARVICESVVSAEPLHTGIMLGTRELKQFTATIPQCAVFSDGWIEIQALDDEGTCIFSWASSSDQGLDGGTSRSNGNVVNHDLSVCLVSSNFNTPMGACCNDDDGSCTDSSFASGCAAFGPSGRFVADTLCSNLTPPCGQITGACCATLDDPGGQFQDGDCQETTAGDCAGTFGGFGVWQGAFVPCTPSPCLGACCDPITGGCSIVGESTCISNGGNYQGDQSNCLDANCPIVLGACCNPNGSCSNNTQFDQCTAVGGSWQGPNSTCSPVGACCLPGGVCVPGTLECCGNSGGNFQGAGTGCGDAVDSGPVNLPINDNQTTTSIINVADSAFVSDVDVAIDITHTFLADLEIDLTHNGVIVRVMQDQCGGNNDMQITFDDEGAPIVCAEPTVGTYIPFAPLSAFDGQNSMGDWTLDVFDDAGADQGTLNNWQIILPGVGMNPCQVGPGACCLSETNCMTNVVFDDCNTMGGLFLGVDSTCDNSPCQVTGACCDPIGICTEVTQFACQALDGLYAGNNSSCVTTTCFGVPAACCNADGTCTSDLTFSECTNPGGTWQGVGSTCPTISGACCTPTSCVISSAECCTNAGGSYVGDGTNCGDAAGMPDAYPSGAVNLPITDLATTNSSINVPDSGGIGDLNVFIDITHTYIGDLEIDVEHNGTIVRVLQDQCNGNDNMQVTFDDEGVALVCANPVTGNYLPLNPLSVFDGSDRIGLWNLAVFDDAGADQGTLNNWTVIIDGFGANPCDGSTGACCVNMVCTANQTVQQCAAAGGTFLPGEDCVAGTCDIRGACCNNITGGCSILSAADCATSNGTYQGDFSLCSPNPCPIVLGACCRPDTSCENDVTFDSCTGSGGSWQGPDSVCGAIGACCLPGGVCVPATQACCEGAGALYQGDGIACGDTIDSGPVNLPILDNQTTTSSVNVADVAPVTDVNVIMDVSHTYLADLEIDLTHSGVTVRIMQDQCIGNDNMLVTLDDEAAGPIVCATPLLGVFQPFSPLAAFDGLNTSGIWTLDVFDDAGADQGTLNNWQLELPGVGMNPCQVGPGACCLSETNCIEDVLFDACEMQGGIFLGVDSTCVDNPCDITGACCDPITGACSELSQFACQAGGGLYNGNNSSCATTFCFETPGACCGPDAACTAGQTFNECQAIGGTWQGPNTSCGTVLGACCVPGGITCSIASEDCCTAAGGTYLGDGSGCGGDYSSTPNVPIPDGDPIGVSDTIVVGETFNVTDADLSLMITHGWVGDLCISLEHNGVVVEVIQHAGADDGSGTCHVDAPFGCASDNYDIVLDDEGTGGPIEDLCGTTTVPTSPPNYTPFQPLSAFDGINASGPWTLTVLDPSVDFPGTLNSWGLQLGGGSNPCDTDPGACCMPNETCVENLVGLDCLAMGGTPQGGGTVCANVDCNITGACCDTLNGTCRIVDTAPECNLANEVYQGDNTTCQAPCPVQTGACCLPDLSCLEGLTFAECETDNAGSWQGDASVCSTITGACCIPGSAECSIATQACCEAAGGQYQGDGVGCGDVIDSGPIGLAINDLATTTSDILVSDSATITDVDLTVDITHTFIGDLDIDLTHLGVVVRVFESQCLGNDDMLVTFDDEGAPIVCATPTVGTYVPFSPLSAFDGQDSAGTWTLDVFDGANLDTGTLNNWQLRLPGVGFNPCLVGPGACCIDETTCIDNITFAECQMQSGFFQGLDSTCVGNPCDITGACCNPTTGACNEVSRFACIALGGLYNGNNSTCAGTVCTETPGACCESDASCSADVTFNECQASGGTWQGPNSDCGTVTGACCFSGAVSCVIATQDCCEAAGGSYQGDATGCGGDFVSSPALAIPDNNQVGVTDTINVGASFNVTDVDIALDISHTFVGDLCISVEHNGILVEVVQRSGADNLTGLCHVGAPNGCALDDYLVVLDDEGTGGSIEALCGVGTTVPTSPPNYTPFEPLSVFDNVDSAGAWTIVVTDNTGIDTGTLNSWSIILGGAPSTCDGPGGCDCTGDVNQDGFVDGDDISLFTACVVSLGGPGCDCADLNNDTMVDLGDVGPFVQALLNNTGPCDGGSGIVCTTCTGDANGDGILDGLDIDAHVSCLLGIGACPCSATMSISELVDLILNSTGLCQP